MSILLILGILCVIMAAGLAALAFFPDLDVFGKKEASFPDNTETAEEVTEEETEEEETSGISAK